MRVDAYFTAGSVDGAAVSGSTAVVIDVIRATSTMVTAFGNGAAAFYPTISTEEAIKLASSLGRDDTLLCGERKGEKIEGFDLGNSPAEYTRDRVEGRRLVMSTTNGTRAFVAVAQAERIVAASFLNLSAVADAVADAEHLVVVCAGKEDRFSLDDAACAGVLLDEALGRAAERDAPAPVLNDAARAALTLSGQLAPDEDFLRSTAAGRALVEIGLDSDLSLCARRDVHDLVPEMDDRVVRVPDSGGRDGGGESDRGD